MSLINYKELKKQLASGEITSLDDITNEFKDILINLKLFRFGF